MSFQAPGTDADPPSGFKAPADDMDPPKSLMGFLSNTVSNAGRVLNPLNIAKGAGDQIKQGAFDVPLEATNTLANTVAKAVGGEENTTEDKTPVEHLLQDPTMEKRAEDTANSEPVQHPVDYAYKNPVDTALTLSSAALPFMGEAAGLKGAGRVRETIPEAAPAAAETPKGLPVIEPGAKTGDPHALFAYNDKFGPGGSERSIYNIFGDPNHPAFQKHGWGSSIPDSELGDIPVTGRQPSAGKFEPIGTKPPPAETPPPPSGTPPPTGETKPPFGETMANDAMAKAQEVKGYISRGYQGFAKKPGAIADVADWVQEKSQMMSAQQMGFTPLQNRQLGATPAAQLEAQRAIGQYGIDSGIVSPTGGLRHMVKTNEQLLNQAGKTLGDIRRAADKVRDPAQMPIDPLQGIHAKWDKVFSGAERSDEVAQYDRALKIVEEHPATFEGMANAATALNKAANKANKLNQPHGAFTDVANTIGQIENQRIRELLPEKAGAYDQALKEFGINKKIEAALKRKVGGEVKRMGPGSMTSNLFQKGMDEVGYRVGARAANKLSTSIKGNPALAGNLPSLFKEFANHIDDTVGEVSGMYQGGTVPDDVKRYVSSKC